MNLKINDGTLEIRLGVFEKILAFHGSFEISLSDIVHVDTVPPDHTWKEIRAPGTYLPGLVKAGTYYSGRGKEFWCVVKGKRPLCIELRNKSYKRMVLGVADNKCWADALNSLV